MKYEDAEEQLLSVLDGSVLPECQIAASVIRTRANQVRELLATHVPERDRLIAKVFAAVDARNAAKLETLDIWNRLAAAEAELDKLKASVRGVIPRPEYSPDLNENQ